MFLSSSLRAGMWALLPLILVNVVVQGRLSDYVDPLIGTVGPIPGSGIAGGNAFPGAVLPWGMVKAGIDTAFLNSDIDTDNNAGYSPLGNVTGISLMHVSGTGGNPTYGVVSQMPLLGTLGNVNIIDNTTYAQNRSLESETAAVGHFTTTLLDGIKIDITASNHSSLIRYTFPSSSQIAHDSSVTLPTNPGISSDSLQTADDVHILVDLTHVLPAQDPGTQTYGQKFYRGDLHIRAGSEQASYYGSATYNGGWPNPESHKIYFCGNFSVPLGSSLVPTSAYANDVGFDRVEGAGTFNWQYDPFWVEAPENPEVRSDTDIQSGPGNQMGLGALFSWTRSGTANGSDSVLETKVGISYLGTEQACAYIENELPGSMAFEDVVEQAQQEWESKVLNRIEVVDDGTAPSQNDTLKRMLYTALYHSALMPTDKTGENPYWNSNDSVPYYDDHYTLWDTYRTLLPMYHLLFTGVYSRVVKGLINIFTYEGYLPAGRAANWNGRVQGGTHADILLGDAFVKSVLSPSGDIGQNELGDINWDEAYRAVLKNGDVMPSRNADSVAFDGATKEGRGALDDYLSLKYITRNHSRSISRGLEYPTNDFSIWTISQGLDRSPEDQSRYLSRASWWENQWNPAANTTLPTLGLNFTGFAGARNTDGNFNLTDYDPLQCIRCGWSGDIYEAKVWETSFSAAPHDMARLITLMGGDEAFVARLDASFVPGLGSSVGTNNDAGTALFNPGNEPSFGIPFMYNYVPGYHWKTVNQSRAIMDEYYSDARNGYPGNIDAGALPSWLLFNMLGFYPVAGQPLYLLGAPRFSSLRVKLLGGTALEHTLSILADGLADDSYYPQTVTLDGRTLDRAWLSHIELISAQELVFEMGPEPKQWDSGARPWSLSGG